MRISSPAFEDNGLIPKQYSRQGDDISIPLDIADVPKGVAGLVYVMTLTRRAQTVGCIGLSGI